MSSLKNKNSSTNWSEIIKSNPEDILMVIHQGNIRLFDKSLLDQLNTLPINLFQFSQISINGSVKFTEGNLPELISAIQSYHPAAQFPVGVFEPMIHPVYD